MPTPSSPRGLGRSAAIPTAFTGSGSLLSVLGAAARIEGTFDIADSLRVDCNVSGALRVGNRLVVGPLGAVHADVETMDIVVMGRYEGNLVAGGSVQIMAGGQVAGRIKTDSLIIEKGSSVEAAVSRLDGRDAGTAPAPLLPDAPRAALPA